MVGQGCDRTTLKNGVEATLGTLEGLTDRPQLFILGIGPKEYRTEFS